MPSDARLSVLKALDDSQRAKILKLLPLGVQVDTVQRLIQALNGALNKHGEIHLTNSTNFYQKPTNSKATGLNQDKRAHQRQHAMSQSHCNQQSLFGLILNALFHRRITCFR